MGMFDKLLRAGEGKKQRALQALVPDINAYGDEMARRCPTTSSPGKTAEFRQRLDNGEDLDDLLIEAFAVDARGGHARASASATTTCS